MVSKINCREQAGQFERVDGADYADVEQAVVGLRARGDLHTSAVGGGVGEGREDCWLFFLREPLGRCALIRNENFHGKSGELKHGGRQTESVATVSPQPARQAIGTACDVGIESNAGDGAEVVSIG